MKTNQIYLYKVKHHPHGKEYIFASRRELPKPLFELLPVVCNTRMGKQIGFISGEAFVSDLPKNKPLKTCYPASEGILRKRGFYKDNEEGWWHPDFDNYDENGMPYWEEPEPEEQEY